VLETANRRLAIQDAWSIEFGSCEDDVTLAIKTDLRLFELILIVV